MPFRSRLIRLRPIELATVTVVGRYAETVPAAWDWMFNWLEQCRQHALPGRGFGFAFDDPRVIPKEECRYCAGDAVPLSWSAEDEGYVTKWRFEGGLFTFRRHRAPYPAIGGVIASVRDAWIPNQGIEQDHTRPVLTIYYSDPRTVPAEKQVADICIPVRDITQAAEICA